MTQRVRPESFSTRPRRSPAGRSEPAARAADAKVKTVPLGSVPRDKGTGRRRRVHDYSDGEPGHGPGEGEGWRRAHRLDGLRPNDFVVYENGKKQKLKFFSSDPFALSAAVIIDLGMPDAAVQKVNQTLSALEGAFSPFDEVAIYTYSEHRGPR